MANTKILVVEDEGIIAKDIEKTLESLEYIVPAIVSSAEEAIIKAAEMHPDLVLMDIVLEGDMDGVQAAEQISDRFDIPVIYLTAYADDKKLQRAMITEPYGYILKPFSERDLYSSIEMALYKHKMERKLRESEQWLTTTLKSMGDAVIATDADRLITFVNPVAEDLTGWKKEDAVGKPLSEVLNLINEETGERGEDPVTKVLRDGVVVGLTNHTVLIAKDGTKRPIDDSGAPIRDDKGNISGVVLVFRDITERRRTEKTLEWLRRQNELILNSAGEGIFGLDLGGNTTFMNPAAAKMLGWNRDEVVGRPAHTIMHHKKADGTSYPQEYCPVCSSFRAGATHHVDDEVFWRKDGTSFPTEFISTPIQEQGKVVGAVMTFKDITQRKLTEKALRESEGRFRSLVETTSDCIWEMDANGMYTYVSPKVKDLLGYEPREVIGKTPFDFMPPEEAQRISSESNAVMKAKKPFYAMENTNLHKDGQEVVLETSGVPIFDEHGLLQGYRGVDRDITDKRKIEEELMKAAKLESLGILAGGIAHDFNNILIAILGNIELAKMYTKPEDEIFTRLREAENASLRAKDLTQQLLTFSRGGAPIKKTAYISELLKDTVSFALSGSNISCDYSISDNLWPVDGDEGQISQIIHNVTINACQAMPEGGTIKFRAKNVEVAAGQSLPLKSGKYVSISVEDQGVGIQKEHIQKIFDPYFTTKQKGSGLGLATAYSIVKRHDGYVQVESKPGAGTTLHLYLPASSKAAGTDKKQKEETYTGKGKILLMDDEATVRDVVGKMIKVLGYEVDFANDGAEAIELYEKAKQAAKPFDAIIMDLTVPGGMGGKEAIQKLIEIDPGAKAIVSSGYSNDPIMADYRKYGFSGVVAKPYKIIELGETLHKVIN